MNLSIYRDKVRACWLGKNIGGTLGGPYEGHRGVFDLTFYTHDITKGVLPNDDLDLQLIWLLAAEKHGKAVNAEILGEHWLTYIPCDWSEYGAGRNNLRRGHLPPVSGMLCNPYAESNGAFIRSEIWACLCPGDPAQAVKYAFEDAIVDHVGEGVYGELFCAAIESAAFVEQDIPTLIDIGLSFIPDDCKLRKCIELVRKCHSDGADWREARKKLLKFSPSPFGLRYIYDNDTPEQNPEPDIPLGKVGDDAAGNVAISVIGLLWGGGDFTNSLCIAANCGEDTDCTAGFIGALMGIMHGTAGIEKKWIEPIGDEIKTCTLDCSRGGVCTTITELTERVTALLPVFCTERMTYPENAEPEISMPSAETFFKPMKTGLFEYIDKRTFLHTNSMFVHKNCTLFDAYLYFDTPYIAVGEDKPMRLAVVNGELQQHWIRLKWHLPEGVSVSTGTQSDFCADMQWGKTKYSAMDFTLRADEMKDGFCEILLELTVSGRPSRVYMPLILLKKTNNGKVE